MADPDYCSAFTKVLDDLLYDSDIPDAHLLYRAQQHLKVLEDPAFRTTNLLPPDHLAPCDPRGAPTYKGIFDAMFRTAEAFDVGWGTRYVSAGICACALYALADCQLRGAVDARSINTELAELLTSLASTWIKDLIAPFPRANIEDRKPPILALDLSNANGFDKPLCFACGKACADHYAGCSGSLSSAAGTPDHSVITPVFQRAIDTQTCRNENHDILFRAFYPPHVSGPEFQFVRNFCQYEGPEPGDLTRAPASMMDPCNTLSMHNTALYDYAYLRWSVHQSPGPPQNPQEYVVTRYKDGAEHGEQSTIQIASGGRFGDSGATRLPSPEILRVHAMTASVLHYSGIQRASVGALRAEDEAHWESKPGHNKASWSALISRKLHLFKPTRTLANLRKHFRSLATDTVCL